ncbi:MAG: homoserine dehydrogenase [Eggerthellaceae bacterium]|nr:homoserine dehydrogenase [Eggerthellaceae bacterium]
MAIIVGLIGTGTVGGGCIEILKQHREDFIHHYGLDIELKRVCSLNPEEAFAHGVEDIFSQDYHDVIDDPEIEIVIELIGGTTIARSIVCEALSAGKNVVTANKALMATYGEEVMGLADKMGKELFFEASVGGGIPIIDPLKHSLIANKISSVMGIVNGTTNYMLTRMSEDGLDYDSALREAQGKGFAEANPTADVDGLDAAAKIAILASIAFNSRVTVGDVHTEGIRSITPFDLEAARDMGYCVKLLALAHRSDKGVDVRVHPTMLPVAHPLSSVGGVYNAIYVIGDAVGETMFFGEGAGSSPAASAVMGDVLECARHVKAGIAPLVGCTCTDKLPFIPIDELFTRYYIHFTVADRAGVLAAMAGIFAKYDVSVHSVVQRGKKAESGKVNLVYVTHTAREASIRSALTDIVELDGVLFGEPSLIRVEE